MKLIINNKIRSHQGQIHHFISNDEIQFHQMSIYIRKNLYMLFFDNFQFCSNFNNNSLTMKQRKKIKYVQKQPPDKGISKINQNTVNQHNIKGKNQDIQSQQHTKVQSIQQDPSINLISEGKKQLYQKETKQKINKQEENRPKYVAKNESQNYMYKQLRSSKHQKKDNDLTSHKKKQQQAPHFSERQSSHHDQLCIICSEQIRRKDWIWTCTCCCISMHLKCIKQWIQNINQQLDKKAHLIFNWKCPQCNYQYNQLIPKYYCYCGKHLNPQYDRDLEPHSCGEICSKRRGTYCPHPCNDVCHSGKCKPCDYEGTLVTCQCGKSQKEVKCSEQRLAFQCGKKCEKILNCHNHKCERNCHAGECTPCKKKHMVSCHCGKSDDIIDCALPSYSCTQVCGKLLNCGYHICEDKCHLGGCNKCHKTPSIQKTCPCGKYEIQMLTGDSEYRKSCADPIPACGMPCSKRLECGHICPRSCHEGSCSQCKVTVDQTCTCGLQNRRIECWRKNRDTFKCQQVCKKKRSCGQHICNEACCKFRISPLIQNHPCQLSCNKMLNCGKHQCGEACHMGLCKRCPVIYSQPQPCPCGKTFLKPPILCGTLVPQCNNLCDRELPCGHTCKNSCHYGFCKCVEDVVISCRCGKQEIATICGRQALCLNKCQLILPCGHKCDLQCHKDTCQIAHKTHPCRKMCNKERRDCHHICPQLCHPDQLCQSFSCEAQILVKCDCGHRQTMSLCGALDHHKIKKAIICNKKCQNLKRFDVLYKDKRTYYPGNMVQFAFKNFAFLQNLESRLEKFILHSDESFIEIEYKFTDNNIKLLLTDLFENHYQLNTHFYRYGKYSAFTLMQSEYTMVPRPVLTEYAKLISQGTIKQSNLPFQFTISFQAEQKQKADLIIKNLRQFLHKYYTQRNNKIISLHFWSKYDGEDALRYLENEYQVMQFKCSFNINKNQEEVAQNQIIQSQDQGRQQISQAFQKRSGLKSKKELIPLDGKKIPQNTSNSQLNRKEQPVDKPQTIKQFSIQNPSRLIIRKGVPNFRKNDYPEAKQSIQDIYLLDEDELYNEPTNWQSLLDAICSKKIGPEALQWRIRSLLIISSFHPISDHIFYQQFSTIIALYNKDKQSAMRILELQRIQNKSVKKDMAENGIYLSDYQPEILSYLQIYNYLSDQKIQLQLPEIIKNTLEMVKVHQILSAIEQRDAEAFFRHLNSADYVLSCAMIPLVHEIRQILLEDIKKGGKVVAKDLYKHLIFQSEAQLLDYALKNGVQIESRASKSSREEFYYLKSGTLIHNLAKDSAFIKTIFEKRDKKNYLIEPEQLVNQKYMTRSFFAFGDFKESINPRYMASLVKLLKQKE